MSTSVGAGVRLEIGHVLFMDLVGYSKLLLDEQREQVQHLTEIVLNTEQVRAAEAAEKLIRLPVGDGMALVFFNSPEAPVRCAIEISEGLKQWQSEQAAQAADESSIPPRKYVFAAAAGLLIAVASFGVWLYFKQPAAISLSPEKTIAVLPFQNFSPDKDNAFFADGVQDDILTSLAKIKDLRVTSRSSVMKFRDAAEQNLRQIGKALGVANVLEGSVRREGDRVVVNVQLVDEQARVTAKPTQNPDAYVFYLRANQISRNPDTLLEDYKTAEQLYMQAIALDPDFALAHARLASVSAEVFHYYEPTEDWETKARTEAQIALRLQPNLAEAHLALGQCFYWMDQDYERAIEQFDIASRLSPSNGDIGRLIAAIKRRQGKWEQSLKEYERVARLDPQNPNTVRELIFTNTAMRRWPEAARWVEQLRAMAPASIVAKIQRGYVEFWWKGDTG